MHEQRKSARYVDLIVKIFEENSKTTQGEGGVESQLRTSKSGVCLDQTWMFVDRREKGSGGSKF